MAQLEVKLNLGRDNGRGQMEVEHGPVIPLASTNDDFGVAPYQMLLGALGYCLYWTLHDILVKQKTEFGEVQLNITGDKKTEGITHLEWAKVDFTIEAAVGNEAKIAKAVELAQKYCSIYYTLSHVAKIEVSFQLK